MYYIDRLWLILYLENQKKIKAQGVVLDNTRKQSKHLSEEFKEKPNPNSRKKPNSSGRYGEYANISKAQITKEQAQQAQQKQSRKGGASRGKKKIKQTENALYSEKLREQNDYNDKFVKLEKLKEEEERIKQKIEEITKREKIYKHEINYSELLTQEEKDEIERKVEELYKQEIKEEARLKEIQLAEEAAKVAAAVLKPKYLRKSLRGDFASISPLSSRSSNGNKSSLNSFSAVCW